MNSEELGRGEHFKMIRENPSYRNFLMLEEIRNEIEPTWGKADVLPEEQTLSSKENNPDGLPLPTPPPGGNYIYIYKRLLQRLEARVIYCENKVMELRSNKAKTDRGEYA